MEIQEQALGTPIFISQTTEEQPGKQEENQEFGFIKTKREEKLLQDSRVTGHALTPSCKSIGITTNC